MRYSLLAFLVASAAFMASCSNSEKTPSYYMPRHSQVASPERASTQVTKVDDASVVVADLGSDAQDGNSDSRASYSYSGEPDYFKMGYDDGYEDGCHLEKGRSYDYSLRGEAAREYRRGYFEGYPDGRADNDPDDEYLYGKHGAEYYDMKDDDDWSDNEEEDWDEDYDEDW